MNSNFGRQFPELSGAAQQLIRIPSELDIQLTPRVRAVIDTPAMQRLKHISQLGLVSHVYPGAIHSRFEHSLGVYRLGCLVLNQLFSTQPSLLESISAQEVRVFLLAALLHDVGHWPYCHPIEDLRLTWVPPHEGLARSLIGTGELASVISEQWQVAPQAVADFLSEASAQPTTRMLQNIMNGPVDIDKMDYLQRDSLHAGVPYGRNFDVGRLISSLRVGEDHSSIAITEKGKTAAEMMVFARYVMFSEVYWHHAVRSATAMLQRLVFRLSDQGSLAAWLTMSDADFARETLKAGCRHASLRKLAEGLFGQRRTLYKRLAEFNFAQTPEVHTALARRPYEQLVQCAQLFGQRLSQQLARPLDENDILIDAPPVKLEVQFNLSVKCGGAAPATVALADISPVVKSLATDQFDNFVKKVRVFVASERRDELSHAPRQLAGWLLDCARELP